MQRAEPTLYARGQSIRLWSKAAAACALAVLGACATVPLDRQVVGHRALSAREAPAKLRCGHRLANVEDRRQDGHVAGHIGRHALSVEDVPRLVRERLSSQGLGDDPALPPVTVEIHQLYLAQSHTTKVPVAVYRVGIGDSPPRILRSNAASMNWNGTDAEGMRALARALDDVDAQLLAELERRCRAPADASRG